MYKKKFYSIKNNFLAIEEKYSNYKDSKVAILPVPFEQTTSYGKGTAGGPSAILAASHYVEFFDEELNRQLCFEKGICSLHPLDVSKKKGKKALATIYEAVNPAKSPFISSGICNASLGSYGKLSRIV